MKHKITATPAIPTEIPMNEMTKGQIGITKFNNYVLKMESGRVALLKNGTSYDDTSTQPVTIVPPGTILHLEVNNG